MQKNNKFHTRSIALSVVFAVVCLIYVIRLVNIRINAEPEEDTGEYYERRETVQAVRGEIYDRNGKKLVSNSYTYDFVFDYAAMSGDRAQQNIHLLQAIYAMQSTGNYDKLTDGGFPFAGAYPNYSYTAEALSADTNTYYRLLKRIAENELEDESPKAKDQLTADYLEEFYASHPEAFPTESEIIEHYLKKYALVDSKGAPVHSDGQTDMLLRLRYNMELADFSVYNSYVMAADVDKDFILYVKELCLPGADFEIRTSRVYEYPGYASHILGRMGKIYAENWEYYKELGYEMNDTVGIDGCEFAFESYLRGIDGVRLIIEDADGNIISQKMETEPKPGQDIYLTIDIDLQIAAEDGLEENVKKYASSESGALVAMDPNTGELLAVASYPTYDLSTFSTDYKDLASNPASPLLDRALEGLYAPGSTFKLGMTALGIDGEYVSRGELLECEGVYTRFSGHQPKCWIYNSATGVGNHGLINASQAIAVSCNCYFYELGWRMGIDKMNTYCTLLGLGQKTGVELPEKLGTLAGPEYREQSGGVAWTAGDTILAAIGQAENSFTPIQLSTYVSTILNGGTRYAARLLYKTSSFSEGGDSYVKPCEVLQQISISDEALLTVKRGMKQMVEDSATVSKYMKNVPVTVIGKTGTAELGGSERENGLFVCAAPYDSPEIVITSVIEHAGGGSYAALAAARVLEAYEFD